MLSISKIYFIKILLILLVRAEKFSVPQRSPSTKESFQKGQTLMIAQIFGNGSNGELFGSPSHK